MSDYVTSNAVQRLWGEYLFAQLFFIIIIYQPTMTHYALQNSLQTIRHIVNIIYTSIYGLQREAFD